MNSIPEIELYWNTLTDMATKIKEQPGNMTEILDTAFGIMNTYIGYTRSNMGVLQFLHRHILNYYPYTSDTYLVQKYPQLMTLFRDR